MNIPIKRRMSVDEFLAWADAQAEGRYELVGGQVVAMAPERLRHVRTKTAVFLELRTAIERAGIGCEAFGDGLGVTIDNEHLRVPDALIQCGNRFDPDTLTATNPVVVVEVVSPSSQRSDTGEKLAEYFSVPAIMHYLIVNPFRRVVIHHARGEEGRIDTRIVGEGEIALSPPGIIVSAAAFFGPDLS
jgi:Uma2 family endonuclease